MEQKFNKNFIEKFGDFYSKLGKRALFNLGIIIFGVLLEFLVLPGIGLGGLIFVFGMYNLLSICEKDKTRYLKTVQIQLPNGKSTPCALFEQKVYAYAPLILAYFSLGFYIPYKKQYYLVHNMELKDPEGTRVPSGFLTFGLLNVESIPKSKYRAFIEDPQIISDELYARNLSRRERFLNEAKSFFETELIEEIYHTDTLSVCKSFDNDCFMLFHYESHSGIQFGLILNNDYIEAIKSDDSFLLESYICIENPKYVVLSNELFERWSMLRNKLNAKKTEGGKADTEGSKDGNDGIDETEKAYMDEVNKNKNVFDRDSISARLKSKKCTRKTFWGCVPYIWCT